MPPGLLWIDPYTGALVQSADRLDVDHMIPLAWASAHGGDRWTRARKAEYANDLSYRWHLLAVDAGQNRAKGSQGPETWVPPNQALACQYGQAWAVVLVTWELRIPAETRRAIRQLVARC